MLTWAVAFTAVRMNWGEVMALAVITIPADVVIVIAVVMGVFSK